MTSKSRKIWFLVVPRTSMINIAGPWEVFGNANDLLGEEVYKLELYGPVGPKTKTRFGLFLSGVRPLPGKFERAPDLVVVAGGSPAEIIPEDHAPIVPWLSKNKAKIKTFVSVCTGAFTLAAAGILDGRRATTHWLHLAKLGTRFPKVRVVDEGIYVKDRGVWTSAGLTAGIDLALALVEEHHGHALAMRVAKRMVLFLRRTGQQAQFSSILQTQEKEMPPLGDISAYVMEHLGEPISVELLAEKVGMSQRTLSRWCRRHLNESPAELVRRLRLSEACRMLEETPLPLKEVVAKTGFGDPSTLWRSFTSDLGVTPAEYRQRFSKNTSSAHHRLALAEN